MSVSHVQQEWGRPENVSQAVVAGDLIVVAGHLGVDVGAEPLPFAEEARVALQRLVATIEKAGGSRETILRVNGFLSGAADFFEFERIYREVIGTGEPMPARTTVVIDGLPAPVNIEVDAIALRA